MPSRPQEQGLTLPPQPSIPPALPSQKFQPALPPSSQSDMFQLPPIPNTPSPAPAIEPAMPAKKAEPSQNYAYKPLEIPPATENAEPPEELPAEEDITKLILPP